MLQPIEQNDWFQRSGRMFAQIAKLGARLDLPDILPLPGNRPTVMAGNHRSLFDLVATMAIFTKFGLSTHILVRADLMESGPGAKLLHSIGCIPTSADTRDEAEALAVEYLLQGKVVSMMPEGRLVKSSEWVDGVGPGRGGVSRIARAAGAVVVPVGFSGTEQVWPRGRPPKIQVPRPVVRLRVGPPIELETDDHVANAATVMAGISALLIP